MKRKPNRAVIREAKVRGIEPVRRFLAMHAGSNAEDMLSTFGTTVPYRWELEEWVKRKDRTSRWSKAGVIFTFLALVVGAITLWEDWRPAGPPPTATVAAPLNQKTTP